MNQFVQICVAVSSLRWNSSTGPAKKIWWHIRNC